jgi:hypothetical protein
MDGMEENKEMGGSSGWGGGLMVMSNAFSVFARIVK